MSETLYRKYRPQRFSEVIGQEHICTTLQHQLEHGKLAHAYLFCGMRGVGKTTVARLLAKAVNCERRKPGDSEPCNHCPSCEAIATGRSLDLLEIDAASNRRIDDIRELREHIPTGPASSKYKVVIVDEVHMLTTEAFNALLKTLEEPPAHVIFVLATTEVHKVPDTILSRCQRFDFRRLSMADLKRRLLTLTKAEGVTVDESVLKDIAYLAGGSTRDAESYLGKLISLGERKIGRTEAGLVLPHSDLDTALSLTKHLIEHEGQAALMLLNQFLEQGGDISWLHRQTLELMRQLLLTKMGGAVASYVQTELDASVIQQLQTLAPEVTLNRLQAMLETWLEAEDSWRASEVYQLPLEIAIVSLCEQNNGSPGQTHATGQAKPMTELTRATLSTTGPIAATGLNLETITSRWGEIVAKLRDVNHSLSFILSIARPERLEGQTLTIVFQYKLHHERLNDPKIRAIVEQALADVLATKLMIKSVVVEAAPAGGDLLSTVLSTFGGKVLEP